jgi:thiamine phosphate synthase YjbQ (UPF0047 family)
MKSRTEYLTFNTPQRVAFINITDQCRAAVKKSGVRGGAAARQCHAHLRLHLYQRQ